MSDDISTWKKRGVLAGTFLAAMLPVLVPAYLDIRGRIDAGKDDQRAHWKAERMHKDSCDVATDSIAAWKADLHTRQNDTMISLLKGHVK
jgi:hypothetical protein